MAYHMILLKKSFDSCTKNMKEEFETVLKVNSPAFPRERSHAMDHSAIRLTAPPLFR
jgi:hypothetical protein